MSSWSVFMSFRLLVIVATTSLPFGAAAQDLDPRFKLMGTVQLETGDAGFELVIPWDTKRERGYAQVKDRAGRAYFTVSGSDVTPSGRPGATQFSVSFMMIGDNPIVSNASFRMGGAEPRVFELISERGNVLFEDVDVIDDTAIRARLTGELTEVDANGGVSPAPVEGAAPMIISATIDVDLVPPN